MALGLEDLNRKLSGHTIVKSLSFNSDLSTGVYDVTLHLVDKDLHPTSEIVLEMSQVSDLCVSGFGGGITQITGLHVKDIRAEQHDRVNYEIIDLEDNVFSLRCRALDLE